MIKKLYQNQIKVKWGRIGIVCGFMLAVGVVNLGCSKDKDSGIPYPYTDYEILHLGNKSGLTSSSSDKAFGDGLNEVLETWIANNPAGEDVTFDGVAYELVNIQEATGAIPNSIWDIFWEKLDEYSYSVGSCWGFTEVKIPSKGGKGMAYILYTIVKEEDMGNGGEVRYMALKCDLNPKSSSGIRSAKIHQLGNREKMNELLKSAKVERRFK